MNLVDSVTRHERLQPPSKFSIWLEEKVLEHDIKTLRNTLRDLEKAQDALTEVIPKKRDDLYKLLDYQRKRGFKHREELHWSLTLVNWQVFSGVMIITVGLYGLWLGLHL